MTRALLKKEFRETRALAAAGLAVLLCFPVYTVVAASHPMLLWDHRMVGQIPFLAGHSGFPAPNTGLVFQHTYFLVAMVLAALIGLRQTWWESWTGTALFLWHRPVSRTRIVAAKLLIGGMFVLATSGLPVLAYAAWAATPGTHASPFLWRFTLPSWVYCGTMLLVYLSACLTGYWTDRQPVVRWLPLIGGVACVACISQGTLGVRVVVALAGVVWLVSNVFDLARRRPSERSRLMLTTSLAVWPIWLCGVAAPSVFGYLDIWRVAENAAWPLPPIQVNANPVGSWDAKTIAVRHDGEVLLYRWPSEFTKLDGAAIDVSEEERFLPIAHLPRPTALPRSWDEPLISFHDGVESNATFWYFLRTGAKGEAANFAGYSPRSKQLVGYLTAAGFQQRPSPPKVTDCFSVGRFPDVLESTFAVYNAEPYVSVKYPARVLLLAGSNLCEIDLRAQTSRVAYRDEALQPALAILKEPRPEDPAEAGRPNLLLRTPRELLVYDVRDGGVRRFPLPERCREIPLQVWVTADGTTAVIDPIEAPQNDYHRLIWLSESGPTKEHHGRPPPRTAVSVNARYSAESILQYPAPAALLLGFVDPFTPWWRDTWWSDISSARQWLTLNPRWPWFHFLAGTGLSLLTFRRCRQYDLSSRATWMLFVFLFGLPGYLAFRWSRRWPTLEHCPACQHLSPSHRDPCLACGHPWERSPPDGTEVFS